MARKLDLYVIRSFLVAFVVVTVAICGLYTATEIFANLHRFTRESGSAWQVLRRVGTVYLLHVPKVLSLLVPVTTLVGAGLAVAELGRHNELTAIKASGVSVQRALFPILAAGVLIAVFSVINREYVVPEIEMRLLPVEQAWIGDKDRLRPVGGFIEEEKAHYAGNYNIPQCLLRGFSVYRQTGDGKWVAQSADKGTWVEGKGWLLTRQHSDKGVLWPTRLTPQDLAIEALGEDYASIQPLSRLIRQVKRQTHAQNARCRVVLYSRMAYPVTGIVLLFLGLPFMLRHESLNRSRIWSAAACVLVAAAFYGVNFLSCNLGDTGHLPPAAAAWLATVLFGAFGLYMFDSIST